MYQKFLLSVLAHLNKAISSVNTVGLIDHADNSQKLKHCQSIHKLTLTKPRA